MESTKKDVQATKNCPHKRDPQKCVVCGYRTQCADCQGNCNHCFYRGLCTHSG